MALPPRGAAKPTRAERQLWEELSAKKEEKKKNAKEMDKLARENAELRTKMIATEEAANNKDPLGGSEAREIAENAESADDKD